MTGRTRPLPAAPRRSWYAVAASENVTRTLVPVTVGGITIVLFRAGDGQPVALEDCCVHRPYPLSLGRLLDDSVQCGLCGFEYGVDGSVVRVPTQERTPAAAAIRSYAVRERHGRVWVWPGDAALARTQHLPDLPWLDSPDWVNVAGRELVAANFLLLHESFADVTKIPVLAPEIAPEALAPVPPPLDVVVSESSVVLQRRYPPSRLPAWHAGAVGVRAVDQFPHLQEGHFVSPGVWVDHWDVAVDGEASHRLRFTHLVTPIDASRTHLTWYLSRDFAVEDESTSKTLEAMFGSYYARLSAALEQSQRLIDEGRGRRQVNVSADLAALRVREIVRSMLAEEGRA